MRLRGWLLLLYKDSLRVFLDFGCGVLQMGSCDSSLLFVVPNLQGDDIVLAANRGILRGVLDALLVSYHHGVLALPLTEISFLCQPSIHVLILCYFCTPGSQVCCEFQDQFL